MDNSDRGRFVRGGEKRATKISLILWISLILGLDGWVPRCRSSGRVTSCGNRVTCIQRTNQGFLSGKNSRMKTYEGINRSEGLLLTNHRVRSRAAGPAQFYETAMACSMPFFLFFASNWGRTIEIYREKICSHGCNNFCNFIIYH